MFGLNSWQLLIQKKNLDRVQIVRGCSKVSAVKQMCVCVCVYIYIYIYTHTHILYAFEKEVDEIKHRKEIKFVYSYGFSQRKRRRKKRRWKKTFSSGDDKHLVLKKAKKKFWFVGEKWM